jgi:hypothetical protein
MYARIVLTLGRWFAALDRAWDRAQRRLDATAGQPLRAWWAPLGLAMIVTVAAVGLTRLLLTAMVSGGSVVLWLGALIVATLALVLLAVVTRNTVISLIEPGHRRLLLIAVLASAATLALSVEAFSALTLAIGGPAGGLWHAERFYLWQLVDSIPLLRLTDRLQWTEPPPLRGVDGRVLVLAFKLLVIPPLARVGLAVYGFVENRRVDRAHQRAIATRVRGARVGQLPSLALYPLAPAAGAIWAGWGHAPLWSLTSLALVAVAIAVLVLATLAYALFNNLVQHMAIPVMAAAVAVVWFSPWFAGLAIWAKVGLTMVAWFALTVALLLVWEKPELPAAVAGLAMLIGFVGADAPAGRWLTHHVSWRLADLPIGTVLATACTWLAVGFVVYLVLQAPYRQPSLGETQGVGIGVALFSDLRAYALVGVHVVLGAATALTLLRAAGLTTARGPGDGLTSGSSALLVAVWHVLDSLPGPSVPGVLEWRLTTDLTGRWAGLVVVLAVAGVVAFSALPLFRTIVLWARLTLHPPEAATPAMTLPREVADRLDAVIAELKTAVPPDKPDATTIDMPYRQRFEDELVAAELAMPQLRDVFGADSPVYDTARRATELTAEAYRIWADSRRSRTPKIGMRKAVRAATAALDELRATLSEFRLVRQDPADQDP